MDRKLEYTVKKEDLTDTAGGVVTLVLKKCLHLTGHEVSRAKFAGITCDGRPIRVSERAEAGQTLAVILPETMDGSKILPSDRPIEILYEDEDLIAINKQAGEVVHPSPGHYTGTLANDVAGYFAKKGIDAVPRITGRLDKETSGVIVFAKNRAAAARLIRERQQGHSGRTYFALCEGIFVKKTGTLTGNMEKAPDVLMLRQMTDDTSGVPAVTHYEVISERTLPWKDGERTIDGASLCRVQIETGRTHQIRLHMASIGHPLVHDTLYGADANAREESHVMSMADGEKRAMLHAAWMTFTQPFTGEAVTVKAPLPADFQVMLNRLSMEIPDR